MKSMLNEKLKGYIEFEGKAKPRIFSVGGFEVKLPNGKSLIFDWCESSASVENNNGKMIFDVALEDFDIEFIKESNEFDLSAISPEMIAQGEILELYYESYLENIDGPSVFLKLKSFELLDGEDVYKFSDEAIERFNKLQEEQWEETA